PLFGGIPATGAIARTATNINSGAVSPFSGIFQGAFVLVTVLLFAPYASYIPVASMAPILMVVAFNMSEYKSFANMLKLKSGDSLVLAATFLLTVFVNLTVAVQIGLLLAMISFVKRMSEVLEVDKILSKRSNDEEQVDMDENGYRCPQLSCLSVEAALFFAAAARFESTLTRSSNRRPEVLVLIMKRVSFVDAP